MKLVIESGITVDTALEQLKNFFNTQCADYPYLKSKMHVYVDLINDRRQVCTDNEKEYAISKDQVVDVLEQEELDIFFGMIDRLGYDLQLLKKKREEKERDITRDKRYLDTAEKKGRKKERIEQRKVDLQEHLAQYAKLQNSIEEYESVINEINNWRFKSKVNIRTEKKYGRNKRAYELILFGQFKTFQWAFSNTSGLSIWPLTH